MVEEESMEVPKAMKVMSTPSRAEGGKVKLTLFEQQEALKIHKEETLEAAAKGKVWSPQPTKKWIEPWVEDSAHVK